MQKLILIFLAMCCLFCSTVVQANQYMDEAKKLVESSKQYAHTLIEKKYVQDLFKEQSYQVKLAEQINADLRQLAKPISDIYQIQETISQLLSKIDVENYLAAIKKRYEYDNALSPVIHKVDAILSNIKEFSSRSSFYANFCGRTVPMLNANTIILSPMNNQPDSGLDYTKYSTLLFLSEDKAIEKVAVTATLIGSIGVLIWNGAALSLTATGVALTTTAVASSLTGIGILVGVVSLITWGVTAHRNKKRKKEAIRKHNHQKQLWQSAVDWYKSQQITDQQYQAMASNFCQSEQWTNKFQNRKQEFENTLAQLSVHSQNLPKQRTELAQVSANLKAAETEYRKQLVTIITEENLAQLRQAVKAEQQVASAWEYYNREIKPKSREFFHTYIRNRSDCVLLQREQQTLTQDIQIKMSMIESHKNTINQHQSDFTDINKRSQSIIDDANRKVQRCQQKNPVPHNLTEVQPIYVF